MKAGPRVAIVLSVVLVLSMVAPPVLATQPDTVPNNQTFTTNNIEVWEESIFTLRHDFEDAPTSAETGDFRAGIGSKDASLNREFVGVRTAGDEVTLTYDAARVQNSSADINQSDVQLIAARVTGSGEPVTTFSEAIDLISQENANTNATFEEVAANVSLSGGEASFDHTGDAGHYVYFAVDRDSGTFSITDGDISIATGTPLVIGVEQITFQRGSPAAVSAPAIAQSGEDLEFDIDVTNRFETDDVTHTVLVYNESTFSDINQGKFRVQVSDRSAIDENFNLSEDAVLFHEINEVNGVADVEDGIEVNGIDISDGRVSRAVSLGSVVDFVAEDIEGNPPQTNATDDVGTVQLNASVTANASRSPEHTVTVETANWAPGSYRYVYIGALESNASAVTTSTGTVSIEEDVDVVTQAASSVADDGSSSVPVSDPDNILSTANFTGLKSGTTASVARVSSPPDRIIERPDTDPDTTPTFVEINAEPATSGGTATVQLTVNKSLFTDVSRAEVYRYNGSQFVPQGATVIDQTPSDVTLEFTTGFSLFAVGQRSASTGGGGSPPPSTGGGGGGGGSLSTGFTVSDLDPEDVEVTQGDEITVTATITTESYLEETQEIAFQIDGETIESQQITLSSQESTTVEFTGIDTSDLEGEYEHGIVTEDDSETGTLTVTVPADAEGDTATDEPADDEAEADEETEQQEETAATEETEDGTPGFGPLVALVAIIAAALLATRRNRQE